MSRAASLPGAEPFLKKRCCFEQASCPGQLRCLGRAFSQKWDFVFEQAICPGQLRCLGQDLFSKKTDFQEFWDSCAQNKTSEISKTALSGILGLLCAEQNVGNLKKCSFMNSGTPVRRTRRRKSQEMDCREFWDSCAQNRTSEISKKCTFRNSGTPVRRTERQKSQNMHFQDFWDSCAKNKTS